MNSARKGAEGEREVCRILRERGYDVQRGGTMSFGERPDVYGIPGVHVEVKRVERLNIQAAMKQSEQDAVRFKDGIPVVIHRVNGGEWLVTMRLEDWSPPDRMGTEKNL